MVCQNLPCVRPTGKCHKGVKRTEKTGPLSQMLTAGDFNSTKPSSGLHSADTKLPLARSGKRLGSVSVYRGSGPGPSVPHPARLTGAPRAPRPAAARALGDTGAAARPGPPSRRGGSPWGHAIAGAAFETAIARQGARGHWGRKGTQDRHSRITATLLRFCPRSPDAPQRVPGSRRT